MKQPCAGLVGRALLALFVLFASEARAGTQQNFGGGGTGYQLDQCGWAQTAPTVLEGGPGGNRYLRLTTAADFHTTNAVGFQRSDPGGATGIVVDFDFRITPGAGRADGLSVVLLATGPHGARGILRTPEGFCPTAEEPNLPRSLGISFDVYTNAGIDPNNNHVSVHWDGAPVAGGVQSPPLDLASGAWIHARIEVQMPALGQPIEAGGAITVVLTPAGGTPVRVLDGLVVPGLVPFESRLYFMARTGGETASHDLASVDARFTSDPARLGQWSEPIDTPVVAIHSALLPTGKILFFDRSVEHTEHTQHTDTMPRLWDPTAPAGQAFAETPHPDLEIFCSGHVFDPQGRLLIFGGHNHEDGFGLATTLAYEAGTNQFTRLADMNDGRWYPTSATLGRGDALVVAGTITPDLNNSLPQVYETRTGRYRNLTGAIRDLPYYPMMFLAPDGRVFNAGPNVDAAFLDTAGRGRWSEAIPSRAGYRDYGAAVLYDAGQVAIIGGGYVFSSVETIDLGDPGAGWRDAPAMAFPRRQLNAVVLPGGEILVTGGSSTPEFNHAGGAVLAAESWRPGSPTWITGAAQRIPRVYHSESVLLPDGRVAVLGGGHPTAIEGADNFNLEIYSPPYLFRGPRPTIHAAPGSMPHGGSFVVATPDAARIGMVSLIRPGSVTHSSSMDQRHLPLPFTAHDGYLVVTVPGNPNLSPPGPYMLFLVDHTGVPSMASRLSVQSAYQQDRLLGLVSIELERHHDSADGGGHAWVRSAPGGHSGTGVLTAQPNDGTNLDRDRAGAGPRVDYWINFTRTGRHFLWLRGRASSDQDDLCHVGLDGVVSEGADRISGFTRGFTPAWTRTTGDGPFATLDVPTTGLHRVSVWMGADGLALDKLFLSATNLIRPTQFGNAGPTESP